MLQSVLSTSDALDLVEATQEVVRDCQTRLNGMLPKVGLVFTSCMDGDFRVMLDSILTAFPGIQLMGCTTDGEISAGVGYSEDSVSLLLIGSATVRFAAGIATDVSKAPEKSLEQVFMTCSHKISGPPRCGFILPDGLTTIGIPLDGILRRIAGERFPFFGGTAGDHYQFRKTYQFFGSEVYTDSAPMLLMGGEIEIRVSVQNGWTPIGPYYPVNRVENNVLYEVDGKSAMDFYSEHLGVEEPIMAHIPLAVYRQPGEQFCLRDSMTGRADGAVEFIGSFPENSFVRLTTVFREDMIKAGNRATEEVLQAEGDEPDLVLVFSCTSRRHILGSRTNEEMERLQARSGLPFFGFYGYGEIAPFALGRSTIFLNDSVVVVGLKGM